MTTRRGRSTPTRPGTRTSSTSRAGFTFLEISIVVMLVAVLSAIAMPIVVNSLDRARMTEATTQVASALDYARGSAAATGRPHRVTFDPVLERVIVEESKHPNLGAIRSASGSVQAATVEAARSWVTVAHPADKRPYVLDFRTLDPGFDIVSADLGGDTVVVFSFPGVPDSAGVCVLRRTGIQKTITVNAATGRVDVQ